MLTLNKKIIFKGYITTLTGLHIGGTNSSMSIGGIDKAVIRNPIDKKPYIPGSSLKGKMRSLIELHHGTIGNKKMGAVLNGPTENPDDLAAKLFGTANNSDRQRPSRIIVRDCLLTSPDAIFKGMDLPYTEAKTEVVIDRITSKAMPRQIERVPAGVTFGLQIVLNIFVEDKNEAQLIAGVISALQLVQDDYIGGSGSRGSGQVQFTLEQISERTGAYYQNESVEKNITSTCNVPKELLEKPKG